MTRNVKIAAIFTAGILVVCITVLGIVAAIGWDLGIMEATGMIIIVGLSVDYSAHLMHAYNAAPALDRLGKARYSVVTLGTSIVAGCITTSAAAIPLFLATIVFFMNFGTFILITVVASLLVALLFVMPLAALCGPGASAKTEGTDSNIETAANGGPS